jgi:pseudouridine-5'-phosphate glycosidase
MTHPLLEISSPVAKALADGQPVVALESTIVTHGMPWPGNLETALEVEGVVRDEGAVPATIAVFDGKIHVGLSADQLALLAKSRDVMKLSRADLAFAISQKRIGSTTVAATMMVAELAGIEVFATGGIGGVHKGAETSFDISADLNELGRTGVIVVSAGAKAILDIEKTLEVLETEGVPVVGYRCDELPAFWSRASGLAAPLRLESPAEIACFWHARKQLGQTGGMLIANPVPEADEIPAGEMSAFIDQSVAMANDDGITGKAVTPYLLGKMLEITRGRSLATNIALVKNNARLAAGIACNLQR